MISMENPKTKKFVYIFSVFFIIFAYFFIDYSINKESVKVIEITEEDNTNAKEVKPAVATLTLNGQTYRTRLKNTNSVEDVLEELRKEGNLTYEFTAYTYGTEITKVNGREAPDGQRWVVLHNDKDITHNVGGTELISGEGEENEFYLVLKPIEEKEEDRR